MFNHLGKLGVGGGLSWDITMRAHTHAPSPPACSGFNEPLAKLWTFKQITSIYVRKKALLRSCPGHPVMIVSGCEPGYRRALQLEREHFPKGGDRS